MENQRGPRGRVGRGRGEFTMGFLEKDKPDIFVSYARVNDIPLAGRQRGWVSTLVSELKSLLAMKFGRSDAFELWTDYRLDGNDSLTPQLGQELKDCAL